MTTNDQAHRAVGLRQWPSVQRSLLRPPPVPASPPRPSRRATSSRTRPLRQHRCRPRRDSGPDPLVPYGTEPTVPYRLGYINPNHDEGNTTNGEVDVPF